MNLRLLLQPREGTMAGRLLFLGTSVQAGPLNLPSSYASSCQCNPWRSSKCRIGFRREKELICSCSKPTSFGLVSTTARADGSVVFRFGDESEMPEDEPQVEASAHFESGVKVITMDLLNEEPESVVCPDATEGVREEEENSDGSLSLALTEDIGFEVIDLCSGVLTEEVDDQLVLSGTMDQPGNSHLVTPASMEGIDLGNGPIEEIQFKSKVSNDFGSDLSIMESIHEGAEEDFMENSMKEPPNPFSLAEYAVPQEDSVIIKNDLDTYLQIKGVSDVDQAGDSLRLENLDTITKDAAPTSIGVDTDITVAIKHSGEHAGVIISDLPNKVEEKDVLNLPSQLISCNISHQAEIIQVSDRPESLPSPSEAAGDENLIDAHEKDMIGTLVALETSTPLNQEEAVENEKASAGLGVAVLVSHEEMQTEKTDVKREDTMEMELYLSSGVASMPHPSKESTGGEDVHFVHGNWLGIADGVGQWSMEGATASSYAQELLENCLEILSSTKSNPMTDPVELIVRGAGETHSSGLSTVMAAYFDGQVFRVAGIGDSGFIVIRNGNVLEQSAPMLDDFNLPLQIHKGIDPWQLIKVYSVRLVEDDVIVLATNGLFDNLYRQEIALIVSDCLKSCLGPNEIAWLLAERAGEVRTSKSVRSPFVDAAHAAGYFGYTGGKLDDVTVLVSLVKSSPDSRSM